MNQSSQPAGAPIPERTDQPTADEIEKLRDDLTLSLRNAILPSFINQLTTSVHGSMISAQTKLNNVLSSKGISLNRVNARRFMALIVEDALKQYLRTSGGTAVSNLVINDPPVQAYIRALVNSVTPGQEEAGRSGLERGITTNINQLKY